MKSRSACAIASDHAGRLSADPAAPARGGGLQLLHVYNRGPETPKVGRWPWKKPESLSNLMQPSLVSGSGLMVRFVAPVLASLLCLATIDAASAQDMAAPGPYDHTSKPGPYVRLDAGGSFTSAAHRSFGNADQGESY